MLHDQCHVCGSLCSYFGKALILEKYDVHYFRCDSCGFIQTEEPYWLDEAYRSPIADIDIGVVKRAIDLSCIAEAVILAFFDCNARFVDYGGGYGLFVRLMRDRGFDFSSFDRYCPNIFAKAYTAAESDNPSYELATALEVFEHLPRPVDDVPRIFGFSRNVLFNTLLVPPSTPRPDEWWYYATQAGQHVSFYTARSLAILASRAGLRVYSDGRQLHLFTEKRISPALFLALARSAVARSATRPLRWRLKDRSLLPRDFERLSGLRLT